MDLIKIYSNNNRKYSRKEYNILDVKLQVFYNCYLSEWYKTTLLYTILENLGKLKLKYFQFIVNKLQKVQQEFTREYYYYYYSFYL